MRATARILFLALLSCTQAARGDDAVESLTRLMGCLESPNPTETLTALVDQRQISERLAQGIDDESCWPFVEPSAKRRAPTRQATSLAEPRSNFLQNARYARKHP